MGEKMNDRFKSRVWDNIDKRYIFTGCIDIAKGRLSVNGFYEENRFFIEQCTGLKDKNGKLVFENDIVKTSFGDFIIKYCENCKQFQLFYDECFACLGDVHWCEFIEELENNSGEVIGNIHQNSELLEKGGK